MKKNFAKRMYRRLYCLYKRANDYQHNCIGCSLMLLTVSLWFKILLDLLFTKMNARSCKRTFFSCYWIYNARKWRWFDEFEFRKTLMKVLQINWMFTVMQISLWKVHFAQLNADWRKWTYSCIIVWLLVQMIAFFL